MSTQELRGPPLRGFRRRRNLPDLNIPPTESRDQGGSSTQNLFQEVQTSQPAQPVQLALIDVEAIDDDVIESSPRSFAEAKNNSRRSCGGNIIVDLDSDRTTILDSGRISDNNRPRRRRIPTSHPVINCKQYINLESSIQSKTQNVAEPPVPPKEPTFTCPICLGSLVEEMSTRCGHIFCKSCIKAALAVQAKCPTCRKRVTVKELIRVFLPSTGAR
ncbi:hypothetical protein SLEP1_g612 [Rubroshorea leprosula]|nr:hypothetical protein SLEP1_g612 [Rubroshorea leprosula]